jgi:hypothetical protein
MRRIHRKVVVVLVQKVLAYVGEHKVADDGKGAKNNWFPRLYSYVGTPVSSLSIAHYRVGVEASNEEDLVLEYYGFLSLEQFFDELLPKVLKVTQSLKFSLD